MKKTILLSLLAASLIMSACAMTHRRSIGHPDFFLYCAAAEKAHFAFVVSQSWKLNSGVCHTRIKFEGSPFITVLPGAKVVLDDATGSVQYVLKSADSKLVINGIAMSH